MRHTTSVSRFLSVNGIIMNMEQITFIEPARDGAIVHFDAKKSAQIDQHGLQHLLRYLDMADEER